MNQKNSAQLAYASHLAGLPEMINDDGKVISLVIAEAKIPRRKTGGPITYLAGHQELRCCQSACGT